MREPLPIDIVERDRKAIFRGMFDKRQRRLALVLAMVSFFVFWEAGHRVHGLLSLAVCSGVALLTMAYFSAQNHARNPFIHPHLQSLWEQCQDRAARLHEAIHQTKKSGVGDLVELPITIDRVKRSLYIALRRADVVMQELRKSEAIGSNGIPPVPSTPVTPSADAAANQLYQMLDRNLADYRAQFNQVVGGIQRAEAQAAVFITTLDTLRMKLFSYRLVGREAAAPNEDFLWALGSAKAQLESIDKALDELHIGPLGTEPIQPAEENHLNA